MCQKMSQSISFALMMDYQSCIDCTIFFDIFSSLLVFRLQKNSIYVITIALFMASIDKFPDFYGAKQIMGKPIKI